MTNLAIECSGTAGSVALFDRETPICYSDLDTSFSSVRTLASEIERLLRGRAKPNLISVTNGPGSFTGLRVGLTTAKMLAMAWKVPVVPVDTLQAIALRAHGAVPQSQKGDPILAVLNAFRGQVFATAVQFLVPAKLTVLLPSCVMESELWRKNPFDGIASDAIGGRVLVSGPGLRNFSLFSDFMDGVSYQTISADVWNPTAVEVAQLGQVNLEGGLARDAFSLEPNYIRASAAEEKSRGIKS